MSEGNDMDPETRAPEAAARSVASDVVERFGSSGTLALGGRVLATAALCALVSASTAGPAQNWLPAVPAAAIESAAPAAVQDFRQPDRRHNFYFTRAIYSGRRGFRRSGSWSIDYPKADRQFMFVLGRLLPGLDVYPYENAVRLDDPELRRFPFLYALEVGSMRLTESEVEGLRGYLQAGGLLVIDDFWGTREWWNFEREISRVLPGRPIVEIPLDHPLFHQFYDIRELIQVPSINNARRGRTWERDGRVPHVRGIFDDNRRLMVVINWNTDMGDAWEWSEQPDYPLKYSNFAYQMAINLIIFSMTH